jgi:hypothetical protein
VDARAAIARQALTPVWDGDDRPAVASGLRSPCCQISRSGVARPYARDRSRRASADQKRARGRRWAIDPRATPARTRPLASHLGKSRAGMSLPFSLRGGVGGRTTRSAWALGGPVAHRPLVLVGLALHRCGFRARL